MSIILIERHSYTKIMIIATSGVVELPSADKI